MFNKISLVNAVNNFQQGRISRREMLHHLNDLILNTPSYYGHLDDDIKHEFYSYIICKIDTILNRYKEIQDIKFEAWFYLAMKRKFFDFIRKKKKQEQSNILEEVQDFRISETPSTYQCIEDDQSVTPEREMIDLCLKNFTKKEIQVMSIKYGFNNLNIDSDSNKTNDNSNTNDNNNTIDSSNDSSIYNLLPDDFTTIIEKKIKRKKKFENMLFNKHRELINIDKKICCELDPDIKSELKQKRKILLEKKRLLEAQYNNVEMCAPNRFIAQKLNISHNTVGVYISKIKCKFNKAIV